MPPKRRGDDGGGGGSSREWGHPDGTPLSDLDLDAEYTGVVTNVGQYGVFVDIGAIKDGLLRVPIKVGRGFKRGMEVHGMTILSCDPDTGKIVLQPDEDSLPEPPPRNPRPDSAPPRRGLALATTGGGRGGGRGGRGGGQRRAQTRSPTRGGGQPKDWSHTGAAPIEDFEEGQAVEGTVTNVSPSGVFVDIGAVRDARLSVPARIGRRFRIGDTVTNCTLEAIDYEMGRMTLALEDPESAVEGLPPKVRGADRTASPRAQAKETPTMSLGDLQVGSIVDGFVSNKNQFGVFIDIGCNKDAKLLVSKSIGERFQKGDEVCGMTIETVDVARNQIAVSLEEPELSIDGDIGPEEPRGRPKPKAKPKSQAAKAEPKAKSKAKAKASGSSSIRSQLSRFKIGQEVDGIVTSISNLRIILDIRAPCDAILNVPRAIARQFRVGDEVHGMTIEEVDLDNEEITLYLEDPELEEPEVSAPPPKKPSAKPKAKTQAAKPAAKKAAAAKDWGHASGMALEELEIGAELAGTVTNSVSSGVFVDIGAVKDARLNVPKQYYKKFRRGAEVDVVVEEVDVESAQLAVGLRDEGAYFSDDVAPDLPKPKAKSKTSPGAKSAAKTKAGQVVERSLSP